jgi:hypothetical protein
MQEDHDMSAQEAAAIMQDARTHARKELAINAPVVCAAAALVMLLGYGAMWLSVRNQHPYTGPSGVSLAAVFVLSGFAVAAVAVVAHRATDGLGGQSLRNRRILVAMWGTGYVTLLAVQGLIAGSVSTRTGAFVDFACPILLAGLVYILASALGRDVPALALGCWLVIAAASCAWQAPANVLATCALAGSAGFLLVALVETRIRAHAG